MPLITELGGQRQIYVVWGQQVGEGNLNIVGLRLWRKLYWDFFPFPVTLEFEIKKNPFLISIVLKDFRIQIIHILWYLRFVLCVYFSQLLKYSFIMRLSLLLQIASPLWNFQISIHWLIPWSGSKSLNTFGVFCFCFFNSDCQYFLRLCYTLITKGPNEKPQHSQEIQRILLTAVGFKIKWIKHKSKSVSWQK